MGAKSHTEQKVIKLREKIKELFVLDLEATSLNLPGNIVEIGIVKLNVRTDKIEPVFHSLIHEKNAVYTGCEWIFEHTDLSPELVQSEGKSIESIFEELQTIFTQNYVMAYNQGYDFKFLKAKGFNLPNTLPDIMFHLTDILKIPNPNPRYKNYKWPSVQECINFYKIDGIEPHRALEDAKFEAQIILRAYRQNHFNFNDPKYRVETDFEKYLRYLSKIESLKHLYFDLIQKKFSLREVNAQQAFDPIIDKISSKIQFMETKTTQYEAKQFKIEQQQKEEAVV